MTTTIKQIIKRDGLQEPFTPSKIENAVLKAYIATGQTECLQEAKTVTMGVLARIEQEVISVEEVQDLVESELMKSGATRSVRRRANSSVTSMAS